jgi:glycosyltransferase involved in cell wall biosynthesis
VTRIAFYAPLKPVDHRTASGDRTVARLLHAALARAGYDVLVASRLRAFVRRPDPRRMTILRDRGEAIAANLSRHWRRLPRSERPAAWFTYHVYYKAVDWIGPRVASTLDIPYVIAEASHAPKRAFGPWSINHEGAEAAIRAADAILCLNPADKECLRQITPASRLRDLPPFLDLAVPAPSSRNEARRLLADRHRLDPDVAWLLAVGMMRPGDKVASYRILGQALKRSGMVRASLLVAGDGPARSQVKAALSGLPIKVVLAGKLSQRDLSLYYAACDLMVWPAINEAFGMALLEAQAAGLPVVAGASGGVPAIIADKETGFLVRPGDAEAFANALRRALKSDLALMGDAARRRVLRRHSLEHASRSLAGLLSRLGALP